LPIHWRSVFDGAVIFEDELVYGYIALLLDVE
jgi:hypothetical protein